MKSGDAEAHQWMRLFTALSYGMPPTGRGEGLGIDRIVMNSHELQNDSRRDSLPLLRPEGEIGHRTASKHRSLAKSKRCLNSFVAGVIFARQRKQVVIP